MRIETTPLVWQLARFAAVGAILSVISTATYLIPAALLGVPPLLANLFAYCAALCAGFFLHSAVSFRGHGSRDRPAERGALFFLVSLVSFALNSLFVWLLTGPLAGPVWWPLLPMTFVTPLLTFSLNRRWVFR